MCRVFVFPNVKEFQFQLARYQGKTYPGKNIPRVATMDVPGMHPHSAPRFWLASVSMTLSVLVILFYPPPPPPVFFFFFFKKKFWGFFFFFYFKKKKKRGFVPASLVPVQGALPFKIFLPPPPPSDLVSCVLKKVTSLEFFCLIYWNKNTSRFDIYSVWKICEGGGLQKCRVHKHLWILTPEHQTGSHVIRFRDKPPVVSFVSLSAPGVLEFLLFSLYGSS